MIRSLAALMIAASIVTSCSSGEKSKALSALAPTKADVARDAGIEFPSSTRTFRLVRIGKGQVDVTFTIDPADVDRFASGSGLELAEGKRVIEHASPLWDVAVDAPVRGASSKHGRVTRNAEVVTDGDTATVRLSLLVS